MWERFSYYGMRALLVLYLIKHVGMNRPDALQIYALYTALVYLTPLLGGYLTDLFLGQRKAILIGGILMALGHFAMAFEPLLNVALGLLILGNGFFKPNISTLVGTLYDDGDERRDGAYTIFYMGINLGAFFSPLVCGTLGEMVGWHWGFGAAGIGMMLGLLSFLMFQKDLGNGGYPPGRPVGPDTRLTWGDWMHILLISAIGVGVVVGILWSWPILSQVWSPVAVMGFGDWILLGYRAALCALMVWGIHLVTKLFRKETPGAPAESFTREEWQRMAVILIVTCFSIMFWMGFEQAGGTMTLFADEHTELSVFGYAFPASWFQSVNPMLIFVLAPLFSMLWTALDRTRFKLPSTAKQGIGLILLGVGFMVMAMADSRAGVLGKVGPYWLVAVYFLHTLAELCLSPVGLSLVNKLSPARVASLMMAVWLLSSFVANYLAGTLESLLHAQAAAGFEINLWIFLIFTSIGPGLLLLALTPWLKKMTHGKD
jgi:POT family proton-dependent oligopeptide transporter